MIGYTVIVKTTMIEKFRRRNVLTKGELAQKFSIHFVTIRKVLGGQPIRLVTARKIAKSMGIKTHDLIEKWIEDDSDTKGYTINDEKK
jgi:ribosome-binding protein aMBF1 (putative translation factor)